MTSKKRSAAEDDNTARVAKVAKVVEGARKKTVNAPALEVFKAKALPLHVNITHTPPTIGEEADEMKTIASEDPGSLGNLTLLPSSFQTGSYGWKGSKRLTIELRDPEGNASEKVQLMLTINATVLGSKQTPGGDKADTIKEDDTQVTKDTAETQENNESD